MPTLGLAASAEALARRSREPSPDGFVLIAGPDGHGSSGEPSSLLGLPSRPARPEEEPKERLSRSAPDKVSSGAGQGGQEGLSERAKPWRKL